MTKGITSAINSRDSHYPEMAKRWVGKNIRTRGFHLFAFIILSRAGLLNHLSNQQSLFINRQSIRLSSE